MLKVRLLVELDGFIKLLLSQESSSLSGKGLAEFLEIVLSLFGNLNASVALSDAGIKVLHLHVDGGQVGVVEHFGGVSLDGLGVELNSLREISLLVEIITLSLERVSIFFRVDALFLLCSHAGLSLCLGFGNCFFSLLLLVFFHLFLHLTSICLRLVLLSLHGIQINTGQFLKDIHESGIALHELHHHLGV